VNGKKVTGPNFSPDYFSWYFRTPLAEKRPKNVIKQKPRKKIGFEFFGQFVAKTFRHNFLLFLGTVLNTHR
jgi:hypothetical protein